LLGGSLEYDVWGIVRNNLFLNVPLGHHKELWSDEDLTRKDGKRVGHKMREVEIYSGDDGKSCTAGKDCWGRT